LRSTHIGQTICRDIWTIHLSLLPNPPPAEPYFHLQETQCETQTNIQKATIPNSKRTQTLPDEGKTSREEDEHGSSESSSEDEEDEEDPEMAQLLRENSASGSSDDDGVVDPALKRSENSTRRAWKKGLLSRYDSPASNVAVLMLACWTMRIPVICADFRKSVIHPTPRNRPLTSLQHYRVA
jgi:RNA polymerase I-specific transcription initiation factor RRN7